MTEIATPPTTAWAKKQLRDMELEYQRARAELVATITANEQAEQAAAANMAERLGLDRQQKRVQAIQAFFEAEVFSRHIESFQGIADRCRAWRDEFRQHAEALEALVDLLPAIHTDIETALWIAANDAYAMYASNPNASADLAWQQTQDLINGDLAGKHDLRTSAAVSVILGRLRAVRLPISSTAIQSNQHGQCPRELARLDVAKIVESWIEQPQSVE